ncbi:MAG: insulinase family protein, partial [Deltaproteobacteria bacterium]|nr:insulinase family protein [Deltaproteobacteria bacterium]
AMNEVNALLSDFKRGDHERAVRAVEPPQNETRIEVIEYDTKLAQIGIAFHVPEQKHHDIFAIDVMSEVLTSGINSRLYKALKIDKQLVTSISTYAMTPKDPGVFLITATLETKNIEETLIDVVSVIKELGRDGANQRELKKIKSSLESSFIYSRETMEGKASQLGYYETISGSLEFEKEYLKGINAVTKEDIKNAVNKYLDFSGMTISLILPSDDTNNISENVLRRYVKKAVSKKQTPKETLKADKNGVIKLTLPNGVTLLVKEDHSNETVGIYSAFTGGIRSEQEETNGIGNLLSGMLTRGTKKYTRQELARELEDISGSIGGFSGRNTTGMSAEFLSKHFDKGFSLFSEVLLNPTFPQTELDLLKQDILAAIKKQEDYIPGYTFKLLYKELYGDHPYSMPVIGTKHSVTDITTDALRDHYKMIFTPERMVIAIVGDVEASYAVKLISESFSSFRSTEAPLPVTPSIISPESIIETGDTKEKQQTNIGIGFTGTTIDSADKYPLKIIAELLGSHGGRLFVELRDKKSLAYSVFAFSRSGIEPGIFGLYIGCSPDKEDEAIESIFTELRKLTSTRVSKKELARVKNSIAGSYEIGLQDVMSQASDMATNELVGLGYDYSERYVKMINKVSANDIKKIAKKFFTLDKYVISVVGPAIDSETEENSAVEDNNENNDHPVN